MKKNALILIFCFIPLYAFALSFEEAKIFTEQEFSWDQSDLDLIYDQGQDIPQNYVKEYVWWSLAKANGNKDAKHNLSILSKKMTTEQIVKAQKTAVAMLKKNKKQKK